MGRSRNSRIWKDKNWDGGLIRDLKINVNHPRLFKVNWDCGYLIQSDQNNLTPPPLPPCPLVKCMYYHMHGDYQHWSEDKYPHTSDKDIEKHEKWCCKKKMIETLLKSTMTTFLFSRVDTIHSLLFVPHMRQWSLSSIPKVARVERFPINSQDVTILWSYLHL